MLARLSFSIHHAISSIASNLMKDTADITITVTGIDLITGKTDEFVVHVMDPCLFVC